MADKTPEIEIIIPDNRGSDTPQLDLYIFGILQDMFGDAIEIAVNSHTSSGIENVKKIEEALASGDASGIEYAAHSLKGASGQFGAMRLSELAQQMETHGNTGEVEQAKSIIDDLKASRDEAQRLMENEIA